RKVGTPIYWGTCRPGPTCNWNCARGKAVERGWLFPCSRRSAVYLMRCPRSKKQECATRSRIDGGASDLASGKRPLPAVVTVLHPDPDSGLGALFGRGTEPCGDLFPVDRHPDRRPLCRCFSGGRATLGYAGGVVSQHGGGASADRCLS